MDLCELLQKSKDVPNLCFKIGANTILEYRIDGNELQYWDSYKWEPSNLEVKYILNAVYEICPDPTSKPMSFSEAIFMCAMDAKVRRRAWNEGQIMMIEDGILITYIPGDGGCDFRPEDIRAVDWEVVE